VVIFITAFGAFLFQTLRERCQMPIFFMAVLALGVFVGMGLLLFYAAYIEGKQAEEAQHNAENVSPELKTHAPVA
jgi:hypothetical protein